MASDKLSSRKQPVAEPPVDIRHVSQLDPYGCAIACTAMVTGQSYEVVRNEWGGAGKGHDWLTWTTYLTNRGWAVQHLWKHDSERRAFRSPWPLQPWADVHLCAVDAGHGEGSHLVVLLRDGTVLDPSTDTPRRWGDYGGVLHMTALVRPATPETTRTDAETVVLKATTELWNAFLKLPNLAVDDVNDVRFHIHALQGIAAATFLSRTNPGFYGSVLTDAEQRDQAGRCSCRGTDDLCPCQNASDAQTRDRRASGGAA